MPWGEATDGDFQSFFWGVEETVLHRKGTDLYSDIQGKPFGSRAGDR